MSAVELLSRRSLAVEIHGWAQDLLRTDSSCGVGRSLTGRYVVIWSGLVDHWITCPDTYGQFLGTLSRDSVVADVENLLEGA